MTPVGWLAGCCFAAAVAAAVAVALRSRGRNARRRLAALTRADDPVPVGAPARRPPSRRLRPPLWTLIVAGTASAGTAATVGGGPVAGAAATAYCGVAVRMLHRRRVDRAAAQSRARALDALYSLAADLRAGAPATTLSIVEGGGQLAGLIDALRRVADQTGAPLADLLERVAADARATDRISAVAAAQAAGAQATAWLLAALPAGGIALGYAIGADPLRVLLHTPIGAGCTAGAIVLQVAGLAWADRIVRPSGTDAGNADAPKGPVGVRAGGSGVRAGRRGVWPGWRGARTGVAR
jgi:tight adherence protein B